jgi:cytochrome P450
MCTGKLPCMNKPLNLPGNAIEAVQHADPYPYYRRLREQQPLFFDPSLGLWVASSAAAVQVALAHEALRVRPASEPVPAALLGTAAADVFASLVRMNDGAFHAMHKPDVIAAAEDVRLQQVAELAADTALALYQSKAPNELVRELPVRVMASALGVPGDRLDDVTRWTEAFVRGIAAGATSSAITQADAAAAALLDYWHQRGYDPIEAAHRIGLAQQSLDATAGLFGNTVALLLNRPELATQLMASQASARELVAEVARWDAPVQNTRRFAAEPFRLLDQRIEPGQGVLLVLASANRDEALNERPDEFETHRDSRRSLTFGADAHACPAEKIAIEIVAAGARFIWAGGRFDSYFRPSGAYAELPNARIPLFAD